ncbi:MAG: hypothetical protein ACYDAO_02600 [Thermoplasmataceae archaeon]
MSNRDKENEVNKQNKVRVHDFYDKFESASKELNATLYTEIESLKFRSVPSYHNYNDLLSHFRSIMNVAKVAGTYQGVAWKITDGNRHSILLVEHETGLEILYVVGAVASVLDIIWKATTLWNRNRFHHFPDSDFDRFAMERRRFDSKGQLVEEAVSSMDTVLFSHLFEMYKDLDARVSKVEEHLKEIVSLQKGITEKARERD